jgi:hypothetical protein
MKSPTKSEGIYNVVVVGAGTAGPDTAGLGGRVALDRAQLNGQRYFSPVLKTILLTSSCSICRKHELIDVRTGHSLVV